MDRENKVRSGKKLGFNVIDALIILLVLACVAGLIIRYTVLNNINAVSGLDTYYISFKITEVSQSQIDAYEMTAKDADGDSWVYLRDGTTYVGHLTDENPPVLLSEVWVEDENGNMVKIHHTELYDVSGKIKCSGIISSETGAFRLNGKIDLATGSVLEVQTKYGDFSIEITGVELALEVE